MATILTGVNQLPEGGDSAGSPKRNAGMFVGSDESGTDAVGIYAPTRTVLALKFGARNG